MLDEQKGGSKDAFNFGTFEEKQFLTQNVGGLKVHQTGGNDIFGGMEAEKPMLETIEINVFIPKDPNELASDKFNVKDILEDNPESLERLSYHVSQ